MQKHANRKNKKKDQDLSNTLEKLFDIAHGNVFEMIDNETKSFQSMKELNEFSILILTKQIINYRRKQIIRRKTNK